MSFAHYRAVGIVLLVVILAALFVLSCWYFKKRSGYKIIRVSPSHHMYRFLSIVVRPFTPLLSFSHQFINLPLHIFFSPLQSPRPGSPSYTGGKYSEAGPSADNKMPLTDFGSVRPAVRNTQLPCHYVNYILSPQSLIER